MTTLSAPALVSARTAVALAFVTSGVQYASFVSRLADVRADLGVTNGPLGLLLVAASVGSMAALPLAGGLVLRFGAAPVVRATAVLCPASLTLGALGATVLGQAWIVAVGLAVFGVATSTWDVAMNIEGAEVERRLGRTLMPQLHGLWSVGAIAGALVGVPMAAAHVPMLLHVGVATGVAGVVAYVATRSFLPVVEHEAGTTRRELVSAWLEPRTLLVGAMVLAFAAAEGGANDWLTLGIIDGYEVPRWVGVAGYAVFMTSMTAGRFGGGRLIDRIGRRPVLWASCAAACGGILLTVYAGQLPLALVGVVVWGLGSAVGFPVGMSAAADDPARSAARVSVVATLGYTAYFIFPPTLGALGDHVGTLRALVVLAGLMVVAALTVFAARKPTA